MIDRLLQKTEQQFGKRIEYQKDCIALSDSIFSKTKQLISPATLRRLYGFLVTNSNPSRVTLDILSQYAGYRNWNHFLESEQSVPADRPEIDPEVIRSVRTKAHKLTEHTIRSIVNRSGIDFSDAIPRQFIDERMAGFLAGSWPAMAVVAPGGFGKSTLLAKWCMQQIQREEQSVTVLFAPATLLDQFAASQTFIDTWLENLLGISGMLNKPCSCKGKGTHKFVIIFDALDEIISNGAKRERVFTAINELAEQFVRSQCFKLVVSSRLSTWREVEKHISNLAHWYYSAPGYLSSYEANIPPLNYEEIQAVLDNTVNKKFKRHTLVFELQPELRTAISYPFFLQLFIRLFNPANPDTLNNRQSILIEFLKKEIYSSAYSDEKSDILRFVACETVHRNRIGKETLKKRFPIHLKTAGNYFPAYRQLVSYGIIVEETLTNSFGISEKFIRIPNIRLVALLYAHHLIAETNGLNRQTLINLENELAENESYPFILPVLFRFAAHEENLPLLHDFFSLTPSVLSNRKGLLELQPILRDIKRHRNELLAHYAKNPTIRKVLFEDMIDLNHITPFYTGIARMLIQKGLVSDSDPFYRTIIRFGNIISLDKRASATPVVPGNRSMESTPPLLAGISFATRILHDYLTNKGRRIESIIGEILGELRARGPFSERVEFTEAILPALFLLNRTREAAMLAPNQPIQQPSSHYSAIAYLSKMLINVFGATKPVTPQDLSSIQQLYPILHPLRSYPWIIAGESLRATLYLQQNKLDQAHSCIRNAVELANASGYRLAEALLMNKFASILEQFGEYRQAIYSRNYAVSLFTPSGIQAPFSNPHGDI